MDREPYLAFAHSKYCRGQFFSPLESNEAQYVEFLVNQIKDQKYDVWIPCSESTAKYCAKYSKQINPYVHFLTSDYPTWSLAANKVSTYAFATKHKIQLPRAYFPEDLAEVLALAKKKIFPCVVKLPVSAASKGVFFIKSESELIKLFQNQDFKGQWPFIQEYIEGDFYSFTAVAYEGKILAYFVHTSPREYSLGGTPPFSFSADDQILRRKASDLIAALNWTGPINLDYLKDKERGYLLLEINPRFPGSLNFAYRMGVDLPWAYCHLAMGGNPNDIRQPSYKEGVLFRTILPTEIVWCFKKPQYRKIFMRNFLKANCKTNIYWGDPNLLWWQIKETRWYYQDMKREAVRKQTVDGFR